MCLPDAPALLGIAAIITAASRLITAWRTNKGVREGEPSPVPHHCPAKRQKGEVETPSDI